MFIILGLVELPRDLPEFGPKLALGGGRLLQRRGQLFHGALEGRAAVFKLGYRASVAFATLLQFLEFYRCCRRAILYYQLVYLH